MLMDQQRAIIFDPGSEEIESDLSGTYLRLKWMIVPKNLDAGQSIHVHTLRHHSWLNKLVPPYRNEPSVNSHADCRCGPIAAGAPVF
jgi:hypothetical protein